MTFDENCKNYFVLHVSFSVSTKNIKILLQTREGLNFEKHLSKRVLSHLSGRLTGKPIVERCIRRHLNLKNFHPPNKETSEKGVSLSER